MLTFFPPKINSETTLEAVEDLTEAFIVCHNQNYIGRVVRSICLPHWLTSDSDERRFDSAETAADALVTNWKTRHNLLELNRF